MPGHESPVRRPLQRTRLRAVEGRCERASESRTPLTLGAIATPQGVPSSASGPATLARPAPYRYDRSYLSLWQAVTDVQIGVNDRTGHPLRVRLMLRTV
jgi:hypothetical protein